MTVDDMLKRLASYCSFNLEIRDRGPHAGTWFVLLKGAYTRGPNTCAPTPREALSSALRWVENQEEMVARRTLGDTP